MPTLSAVPRSERADDVNAHCARAKAAGATIIEALVEMPYGDRRLAAETRGHEWTFATPKANLRQ
ncbi:MAG: hypothetical protein M3T56_04910 [Chloroflexota bacterium]|nr:hypothetical protein [Chloroflexota bacterium]